MDADGMHSDRLIFDQPDIAFVEELAGFVAIPSVSRDASADTMRRAAEWLTGQLEFATPRIEPTDGHPVVRADWLGAEGAPTILVYGHYDVQPTGDEAEWISPPFELTTDGDVVRGRGATDDKGPIYIVLKTAQAFIAQHGALPLNIKFLFEGEEEIGSPHLPAYVREHAAELTADLVVSADGAMWRPTEPSVSLASKGLVSLDLTVEGAAIPDLSASRRDEIATVNFSGRKFVEELGLPEAHGERGYSTLERLWERPTLDVNGIAAGGKYTVIPHVATGHVSCRLVPGQDPDAVLDSIAAHVQAQPTSGAKVTAAPDAARVAAYTIPASHPAIRAATAALESVYPGQAVLQACVPGTLPATELFESVLGVKTLFFSFSTADEKLHAPNEFLRIRRLREGMAAWEQLWRLLAEGL
jgi:acetylornithine deacetylase/succinyl-diaminopimelate desuccinylase-like protein